MNEKWRGRLSLLLWIDFSEKMNVFILGKWYISISGKSSAEICHSLLVDNWEIECLLQMYRNHRLTPDTDEGEPCSYIPTQYIREMGGMFNTQLNCLLERTKSCGSADYIIIIHIKFIWSFLALIYIHIYFLYLASIGHI